jgi:hypothetical protein
MHDFSNKHTLAGAVKIQELELKLKPGTKTIKAEVVFGAPSMGCAGVGICKIIAQGLQHRQTCPRVIAHISVTEQGNIFMQFFKPSMKPRFVVRHFKGRTFRVKEPFLLPEFLLLQLGLSQASYRINPGLFQVKETNDWMIVKF